MTYKYLNSSKKKESNGCLWKLTLMLIAVLLVAGLTLYGLFKVSGTAYEVAKTEIKEKVFGEPEGPKNTIVVKDSVKPTISIENSPLYRKPKYEVPIEVCDEGIKLIAKINGVDVKFLLDTGCSHVSISPAELYYIHRMGKINKDKPIADGYSTLADGSKKKHWVYLAKDFAIGDSVFHDVEIFMLESIDAEPLLGTSVLRQLGVVRIDYENHKLFID